MKQKNQDKQIKNKAESTCPFCNPSPDRPILAESATAYAITDKFPVSPGHTLIIPKRHCASYFDLSYEEQSECWFMINDVKKQLQTKYNPDGFNIGVNINEPAGQTIPHVHIHIIPRFKGDVENPTGGVRSVIPEKQDYTK